MPKRCVMPLQTKYYTVEDHNQDRAQDQGSLSLFTLSVTEIRIWFQMSVLRFLLAVFLFHMGQITLKRHKKQLA